MPRPDAIASSLSDSFTRSSLASFITVLPLAAEAAMLRIGISSMIFGIMEPPISVPFKDDDMTSISPTFSLHFICSFKIFICAPIFFNTPIRPHLLSFKPTFFIRILEFFAIKPATIKKDADEKSPATLYSGCDLSSEGNKVIFVPCSCSSTQISPPKYSIILSV